MEPRLAEALWKRPVSEDMPLAEGPLWTAYYTVLTCWAAGYMVVAFRRVYGDSWTRAVDGSRKERDPPQGARP